MVQPFTLLGFVYHFSGTGKSVLALLSSVIVAHTNGGYPRDVYSRVTGTRGSLACSGSEHLALCVEGVRACTSHRLDREIKQLSIFSSHYPYPQP